MAKTKYPRSENIKQTFTGASTYVSWGATEKSKVNALREWGGAVDEFCSIDKSKATFFQDLSNIAPNVGGRPGFSMADYYRFRPDEAPPQKIKESIIRCSLAYHEVGIVRNIIDLMGDFACQGVRLVHPNKRIEKFFQNWFERVNGKERSERFLNYLYRAGNVIVRKQMAKIDIDTESTLYKSFAKPDMDVKMMKVTSKEIPWKYVFLDPSTIEVMGGALASFVGEPMYTIVIPDGIRRFIVRPRDDVERAMVAQIPQDIINAAQSHKPYLLPIDKTEVYHYKKDDWQEWAVPMIHSILTDINILQKLKLADMAALDGAISKIRIFRLGSLEHKIAPQRSATAKLASILGNNTGGGVMDIIWGPDIDIIESETDIHQFLGNSKFEPHLTSIFGGLGIPATLTGIVEGGGATNNYISLKTLMQRLQYGRDVLTSFWHKQILMVQKAMGFRFPAHLEFDINVLGDEASEKALLIQLYDRNLASDEYIQYRFKHDPDMEKIRLNRENRDRIEGRMVPKAGPYYDPQFGIALKKVALQSGQATPGQIGLRKDAPLNDMKTYLPEKGEQTLNDFKKDQLKVQTALKSSNMPGQKPTKVGVPGRPKNSKDSVKRKTKNFKPKTKAALVSLWSTKAQEYINKVVGDMYIEYVGKQNARQLTAEEIGTVEQLKFETLFSLEPLTNINEDVVAASIASSSIDGVILDTYQEWVKTLSSELNRQLTMDELRQVQTTLYTNIYGDDDGEI